jgi:hypothetical protein
MRKIEMLYNKAVELNKEYEQKVREANILNWDTKKLVDSIVIYYECHDNPVIASKAFWAEEALRKNLSEKDKEDLFNQAKSIFYRLVIQKYNYNKENNKMLWEYEFDYNKLCSDIDKSINSMIKYYNDFLAFKELDGEINAYFVFKNIIDKYNKYIEYNKEMSVIRKDKFYKTVFSMLQEKSFTGDKKIDVILDKLYNFNKDSDEKYMRIGWRKSDQLVYNILDLLKERVSKLNPVQEHDYTGDSKRHSWWLIREYINYKFSRKLLYKEETNWDVKNKLGDIIKYFLEEIRSLEIEYKKNNTTKEYRHLYDKVLEDISIFYRGY